MIYKRTTRRTVADPISGSWPIAGIKKATGAAQSAAGTASGTAGGYGTSATGISSELVPQLQQQAKNPTGFTPEEQNNQLVAAEEGAGGASSGVAGTAGLTAARSRNNAALGGVLDEAARSKTRATAGAGLDIANRNAMLKQEQKRAAQGELAGLYGTDVNAQLKAEGLVPEDINAWANANKTGWLQDVDQTLQAVGGASKGPMAYV